MRDCTINMTGATGNFPSECTAANLQNTTNNGEILKTQLTSLLNDAIKAKDELGGTKNTFISTITNSVNVQESATCMAVAVNSIGLNLKSARNITIEGCNFSQDASVNISRCINNVSITTPEGKTMPLTSYVQAEIDNSNRYDGVVDPDTKTLVPSVPGINNPFPAKVAAYVMMGLVVVTLLSFFLLLRKNKT